MHNKQTARFWTTHPMGGLVRVKLTNGQRTCHTHFQRTEEGWNTECTWFYFDGTYVTAQHASDGVDCDGRMSRASEARCPCEFLEAGYHDEQEGVTFPRWQLGESSQRDYSAEAMGY